MTPYFGGVAACGSSEHSVPVWAHNGYVSGFDPNYTEMLALQGTNAGFGTWLGGAAGGSVQRVAEARTDGRMKVVVIDPRCSEGANKGDEWIPILPGTDLAFNLAMLHVMLHELNGFDPEFVKRHTNGPYPIQPNGYYSRGDEDKPLVWDAASGTAKPFDDPSIGEFTLEGVYEVNGEPCKPAFQLLKERMAPYTPEWAESITTVPASTIRRLTADFVRMAKIGATVKIDGVEFPYRPVAMIGYHGSERHYNGPFHTMALRLINCLVGNYDVPGGNRGWADTFATQTNTRIYDLPPPRDGMLELFPDSSVEFPPDPNLQQFYPLATHTKASWISWTVSEREWREKFRVPYTLKALCLGGTNPFRNIGSLEQTEKALKAIEHVFTISIYLDEPALFADVVLPQDCAAERLELHPYSAMFQFGYRGTMLRQRVVGRLYDTRHSDEICTDLSERLGVLYGPGGYMTLS